MRKKNDIVKEDRIYMRKMIDKRIKDFEVLGKNPSKYSILCQILYPLIRPIILILLGAVLLILEQGRPLLNFGVIPYVLFGVAVYDLWCNI